MIDQFGAIDGLSVPRGDGCCNDATTTTSANLGSLNGIIGSDSVSLVGTPVFNFSDINAEPSKAVAASGLSLAGPDVRNYTLTLVQAGTASINPAMLYYVANTAARPYGAANPSLSGSVTGFAGSDTTASTTTGSPAFSTTASPSSDAGTWAINGSGLTLTTTNYKLAQASSNASAFTISPIVISFASVSRPQSHSNPVFNVLSSGPATPFLESVLGGLVLVTDAPADSTPGTYQISALVPQSLTNDITVQPGTLTIIDDFLPASMQTIQQPSLPQPKPQTAHNAGSFEISIAPAQAWTVTSQGATGPSDALSHTSFADSSDDQTTYNKGGQQ